MHTTRRRHAPHKHNTTVTLVLLLVLGFDAALALWAWNWYQGRRETYQSAADPEMAAEPARMEPSQPPPLETAPAPPPSASPLPLSAGVPLRGLSREPTRARPAAPTKTSAKPEVRAHLGKAVSAYEVLRGSPKYKRSGFVKAWSDEFLSHPDLRAINHRYHRDRDAMAFIASAVRSPSFGKVFLKFASSPSLSSFVRDLLGRPGVGQSASVLMEDKSMAAAVGSLRLPGLPPLSALVGSGGRGPDQAEMLRSLTEANPQLRQALEGGRRR